MYVGSYNPVFAYYLEVSTPFGLPRVYSKLAKSRGPNCPSPPKKNQLNVIIFAT